MKHCQHEYENPVTKTEKLHNYREFTGTITRTSFECSKCGNMLYTVSSKKEEK